MKYKFSLLLIIVNFLLFSSLLAQNKEAVIKEIRQIVQNINNSKNLKKIVLRNEEFLEDVPDGGGELTGYFKNNELVKMVESIGLSNGINNTEYYLKDNQLIFVYEVSKNFQVNPKTFSFDYTKLHTIFEARYYCYKNQLLDVKIKSTSDFNPAKDYINELIKRADQYSTLLKSKKTLIFITSFYQKSDKISLF